MAQTAESWVNVGDVIAGRYRVDRVLGAGAMGVVVAVTHVELHQPRAIKFMLPEMMHDRESVERFLREARAVAKLESRHAVKVHDVARLPTGEPYIVMEYLEGVDLKQHLHRRRMLPVQEAVGYMLQACEALAEAHAAGIVHRDLKPANMFLVEREGVAPYIKVLDFGIAKVNDGAATGADGQLTSTHTVIGSPLFMSPEQILSTRNVDARSDVWSMGVILYISITGMIPFRGDSTHAIFASVQRDPPIPPSSVTMDVPLELERVIMRCLEKDLDLRYRNAGELAAALAPFGPNAPRRSYTDAVPAVIEATGATQVWHPSSPQLPSAVPASAPSGSHSQSQPGPPSYSPPVGPGYAQPGAPGHSPSWPQAPAPSSSHSHSQPGSHSHSQPGSHSHSQPGSQPPGSQSYPQPGAQSYPQPGAQGYSQPGPPQLASQSYSLPVSPSYSQPISQGYPPAGLPSSLQAGAQTNAPMTRPIEATATRKRTRELVLAGGGFATALVIVGIVVALSRGDSRSGGTHEGSEAIAAESTRAAAAPPPAEVLAPPPRAAPEPLETLPAASGVAAPPLEPVNGASAAKGTPPTNAGGQQPVAKPKPAPSPAPVPPPATTPAAAPRPTSGGGAPLKKRHD